MYIYLLFQRAFCNFFVSRNLIIPFNLPTQGTCMILSWPISCRWFHLTHIHNYWILHWDVRMFFFVGRNKEVWFFFPLMFFFLFCSEVICKKTYIVSTYTWSRTWPRRYATTGSSSVVLICFLYKIMDAWRPVKRNGVLHIDQKGEMIGEGYNEGARLGINAWPEVMRR